MIRGEDLPGEVGDELEVRLPYSSGRPIAIESEILRFVVENEVRRAVAVRFARLSTEAEKQLERVLEMLLSGSGGGRRVYPRVAQRLEVYFDDPSDIRATLEDISRGGLSVTVPYSFSVNQSVQLMVLGPPGFQELRLRARVVRQTPLDEGGLNLYRIGLAFGHPTTELQETVQRMLQAMAGRETLAKRRWMKE